MLIFLDVKRFLNETKMTYIRNDLESDIVKYVSASKKLTTDNQARAALLNLEGVIVCRVIKLA
ncbi:hypothetical protein JCM16418A_37370 [Paenibacillus pini]